ncbi:MAG: 4-(cytidine 5'-diphospho)-2-C-methyl-D-erythritol kinase [Ginsengibacter sp.]
MITFPNCKINLGLNVVRKREDGFHDIETAFLPVPFYDVLEIVSSSEETTEIITTGLTIITDDENICLKAFRLLKNDFPSLPEIKIHLHKSIPIGAGLGGGSSDAASMLLLLNKKFNLQIERKKLLSYSLQLGSDCPFFIINKPCYARGRGEILQQINLSLSDYKMVLINPGIHINTSELFQLIKINTQTKPINEIIQQPVSAWKGELVNDFEKIVFLRYPVIKKIKENLYKHKALYAAMTGTGSTVFGIFNKTDEINLFLEEEYFHRWFDLS